MLFIVMPSTLMLSYYSWRWGLYVRLIIINKSIFQVLHAISLDVLLNVAI